MIIRMGNKKRMIKMMMKENNWKMKQMVKEKKKLKEMEMEKNKKTKIKEENMTKRIIMIKP